MSLRQLETVETELKYKRYSQNKILELTGMKRRSRGHQERLKRIKDGIDMAETRFRGFSVKKQGLGGLSARYQGLKHNFIHKQRGLCVKRGEKDLWWKNLRKTGAKS
jgi:hypothetical protein